MSAVTETDVQTEYRRLPSVEALLQNPEVVLLSSVHGQKLVTDAVRTLIDNARLAISQGGTAPEHHAWPLLLDSHLANISQPLLRPVINATGVILHTNLGRAPLSEGAREAITLVTRQFNNLEYDLEAGKRGSRYSHARALLTQLTGAEDALVVNNCASAVFLALSALCRGREVVVSRGQLVEIGGGFRIPDVLRQSGTTLVEVGTTNRTHARDFEDAINPQTAALMRIHSSNFRLMGFVTMPELADLVEIAHAVEVNYSSIEPRNRPTFERLPMTRPIVIDDLGSGTLLKTQTYGLEPEPTIQESIVAGADVVTFSGDKLLGGPQAGILVGRQACIKRLRKHPLARALRVDKMTLAALEATLRSYAAERATEEIPVWRMISASQEQMADMARRWQARLAAMNIKSLIWSGESAIGGGSLPGETLPTALLVLPIPNPDSCAAQLRNYDPPIICRIQRGHLIFDPRTILSGQEDSLLSAIQELAG